MSKAHKIKDLQKQWSARTLLAVSLAASLAAFGCTTNHNLGSGTPTRSGPEIRSAPTSGVTGGSERETPVLPPPMTSSFTTVDPLPKVEARTVSRADAAAAIMARHQAVRGRYLGVVNPGPSSRGYVSDARPTGQLIPPALLANPQLTVNSSISSNPFPAITSGAGDTLGASNANAAAIVNGDATAATTALGIGLPTGTFAAAGSTLPTAASSGIPTVTAASSGVATPTATATTAVTGPTVTAVAGTAPTATAAGAVRIERGSGGVTVTNAAPATAAGRSN